MSDFKYHRVYTHHLDNQWRKDNRLQNQFVKGGPQALGQGGGGPTCYAVLVMDPDEKTWETIGYVLGHNKYGKVGWEVWSPVNGVLLTTGISTRAGAACVLREIARAMGATNG